MEDFKIGMNVEHKLKHISGTIHAVARDVVKVAFVGPKPNAKAPNPIMYMNCKPEELRQI